MIKYINEINKLYFNYKIKTKKPDIIHFTYNYDLESFESKAKIVLTEYDLTKEKLYASKYQDLKKKKEKFLIKLTKLFAFQIKQKMTFNKNIILIILKFQL